MTNLAYDAFGNCTNLTEAFFEGNVPGLTSFWDGSDDLFDGDNATVYYLPGATGWSTNFAGAPAVMGNPTLTLLTNGLGSITPGDNGALLPLGAKFTLTATPHHGFKFVNWTGGTNQPLTVLTNGPKLQFTMQLNEILQANFVETSRPTLHLQLASPRSAPPSGSVLTLEKSSDLAGHIEYSTNLINWIRWKNFSSGSSAISFQDLKPPTPFSGFTRGGAIADAKKNGLFHPPRLVGAGFSLFRNPNSEFRTQTGCC